MSLRNASSESAGQQELPQSTIASENADLMREYCFCYPDVVSGRPSVMKTDPVITKLRQIEEFRFSRHVMLQSYYTVDPALHCKTSTGAIRNTISHWLSDITRDARTHLQVAQCNQNSLYDILPDAWASAVITVAKAQGFHPEMFHLGLVSNLSFMDHHRTKLRITGPSDQRAIISDIAVVLGSSASCKKSHMKKDLNIFLIQHSDVDVYSSPVVPLAHGNIKRVRRCLQQTRSAHITSSDPIHIIRTPYLEDYESAHFLPRTLINTWTQGEEDELGMGHGNMNLKDYKFKFLLLGRSKLRSRSVDPRCKASRKESPCVFNQGM